MEDQQQSRSSTAGKLIRCKAAVARVAGEPLVIEEIIVAPPKKHEIRIKIICTSLCHTDVSLWKITGPPLAFFPRIFGHEAIGIVESVGGNVDEFAEGDTVIPSYMSDCGECADCKSEESNLCSKFPFDLSPWMPREESSRFTDLDGNVLYHFLRVSSFSEFTVVDVAHVVKIDPSAPPSRACLLGCGVSTGVGAACKAAKVKAGSTVAIFGLGAIGLAVAEGARLSGASKIIGIDINPDKFETGKKFGVTDFLNPKDNDTKPMSQIIIEMTSGGADYCFECVGMSSLMQEAYNSSRKGWGKTIVLGAAVPGEQIALSCFDVLCTGKTLTGSIFGNLKAKSDIPILLKRYMDKELNLDDFVTHAIDFEDINKAFDMLISGECIRCIIWIGKEVNANVSSAA